MQFNFLEAFKTEITFSATITKKNTKNKCIQLFFAANNNSFVKNARLNINIKKKL